MLSEITIIGNLGAKPELRYTPNGTAVANVGVASNRKWKNGAGEEQAETIWHRVTFWNKLAEVVAEYLDTGSKVFIKGRLKPDPETGGPRVWQRKDGSWGASYEVTAQTVKFLDSRPANTGPTPRAADGPPDLVADDIPF